jgi:protein SCO1/2
MVKLSVWRACVDFAAAAAARSRCWIWPGLLLLPLSGNAPGQGNAYPHQTALAAAAATRTEHAYFVPDVVLTDSDGKTVALRPLTETNQPVMLDFIYTSCTATCPLLSETFAQVQRELGAGAAGLRMISISIDPEYDTPKVLRTYAQTYHPGTQWRFLTGNPKDITEVQQAFEAYRANKMDHAAIVFLRSAPGKPWVRFDGLVDPATLVREYRAMQR